MGPALSSLPRSPSARDGRLPRWTALGALTISLLIALCSASWARAATYVIPSSIASNCSVDVTQPILSWIATVPDNSVLSFGNGACYRVEGTLELSSRTGLDFEGNGSTFRSLDPPSDTRPIWRFFDSSGIVLNNMTIDGSYAYGGTFDPSLQHAHAIDLWGTNIDVGNVTMTDVAGDCVYFGEGWTSPTTRSSGSLHDSTCSSIGRSAVSITAGNDITIERVTTSVIGYDVFNIEPDTGIGFGSQRVTITDNTIGSYSLVAFSLVPNAPITDQTFSNNHVVGQGLKVATGTGAYRPQNVTITGNSADTAQPPFAMNFTGIDGLTVTGNTVPLTYGTMASVDNSCNVNVSGNSYPGGSSEVSISNPPSNCSAPAPAIASFSPASGPVGTSVRISGSGFLGATTVAFNGVPAAFVVSSNTQIRATVPSSATTGPISITAPGGTAVSSSSFTVSLPPTIRSFSPLSGRVGTVVTITGSGFTGATSVAFGGKAATFTVISSTLITAIVPSGASSGPITVTTPIGTATSKKPFRVTNSHQRPPNPKRP